MRKFQLLVLAAAVAAGIIWWGFYRTHHTSSLGVASLLPKETLALVHLPDFNRSRADWHRTDLYQLWKEPAVQDFLAKPRSTVPAQGRIGQTVDEISTIEMKDAFFALISIEASAWKWDGGFRCANDPEKAAKLAEEWRARALGGEPDVKHEMIDYQGRQIHNDSAGLIQVWTVWAGPWFFFANNLENLKALLDRADGRVKDPATALSSDDVFLAASKHMPANYAAFVFGRVNQLAAKLMEAEEPGPSDRLTIVREIRSFCATMAFDGGRMHDTVFVGMPRAAELGNLTRAPLTITASNTDDVQWTHREKEGAHYYSSSTGLSLFSFSSTIGLSHRMLVIGPDGGSVETAIKHSATSSSELTATRNFQNAERALPTARQA